MGRETKTLDHIPLGYQTKLCLRRLKKSEEVKCEYDQTAILESLKNQDEKATKLVEMVNKFCEEQDIMHEAYWKRELPNGAWNNLECEVKRRTEEIWPRREPVKQEGTETT